MTHPRKKKNAREIRIDGNVFRWRFSTGAESSEIVVRHLTRGEAALTLSLPGWRDPWLSLSGFTITKGPPETLQLHTSATNEPASITPGFVARAIRRALALGWEPARGSAFALTYQDGDFHAVGRDAGER
jgi:hypothetical protein